MLVISNRSIAISFAGGVTLQDVYAAAENEESPGKVDVVTLTAGNNTITPPSSGVVALDCLIIPPIGNVEPITLKGINGDTGKALHPTRAALIPLDSPTDTFVLSVVNEVEGVRLIWL